MNAPTVSMLVLAATAGLAAGFLLAWLFLRGKQSRQASEREALKQELDDYRSRVDQHFADTAEAVDALNRSYQNVIRHLSNGAQTLMGKDNWPSAAIKPLRWAIWPVRCCPPQSRTDSKARRSKSKPKPSNRQAKPVCKPKRRKKR